LWESLIPYLNQSDITYANYEGPSAPVKLYPNGTCVFLEVPPERKYGNIYRSWEYDVTGNMGNAFNFHESLAKDVKQSGIDVVSLANNHILDMCNIGLEKTMEYLDQENLAFIGTKYVFEKNWYKIMKVQGLNIAWVSCTEITQRKVKTKLVLFCSNKAFIETIKYLKNDIKDIDGIVVAIHGGLAYSYFPNDIIKKYSFDAIKAGASLVLANHPHVSQPIETFVYENRTNAVVWSIGNFVSHQGYSKNDNRQRTYDIRRRASGILTFRMKKSENGLEFDCMQYVPTCVICKEEPSTEFKVVHALKNPECVYEKQWLENVWGKNSDKCGRIEPTSFEELETKWKNIGENITQDEMKSNTRLIGHGSCQRNIAMYDYGL
jgi:poly-gamma-glutamate synthesis protein (capsule biosynthesis protein)